MSSHSSPIDIAAPNKRYGSNSPRNKTSSLTSALQQANAGSSPMQGSSRLSNNDIKATSSRKDSLAVPNNSSTSGAKPISMSSRNRRESGPGSFMGGLSWGGMSIGSFLQDDIMMGGLSPNVNSPSFHSSSYLPKMEANFWTNLRCCNSYFSDLHELAHHIETNHPKQTAITPFGNGGLPRRKSSTTNPGDWNAHNRGTWSENRLNGLPSSRFGGAFQDGGRKPSTVGMQDMDTIGEMELDDDDPTTAGQGYGQFQPQVDGYSSESTPQMSRAVPSGGLDGPSGLQSNTSPPPGGHHNQSNYNNAMFSSMTQQLNSQNRPNVPQSQFGQSQNFNQMSDNGFQSQTGGNAVPFNSHMFDRLSSSFGKMDFGSNNDMRDLCINEPAKNLYSDDGTFNTHQYPQFNFGSNTVGGGGGGDITNNNDENAKKLQAQRLAAGIGKQPTEEERPFKCPVIGCEKAYKNANGLRYHEKHGHSNQKLKENGDGTFSIVDPLTSIPYPGTVGMEKEKPYRCEVCGKRYKNLNGLKYHRNHSPPCNPDFQMNQMPNLPDGEAVF